MSQCMTCLHHIEESMRLIVSKLCYAREVSTQCWGNERAVVELLVKIGPSYFLSDT